MLLTGHISHFRTISSWTLESRPGHNCYLLITCLIMAHCWYNITSWQFLLPEHNRDTNVKSWYGILKLLRRLEIDSARLHRLVSRYDNPLPTRFQGPIGCSKIPALNTIAVSNASVTSNSWNKQSLPEHKSYFTFYSRYTTRLQMPRHFFTHYCLKKSPMMIC
jgi:hypothetical protein